MTLTLENHLDLIEMNRHVEYLYDHPGHFVRILLYTHKADRSRYPDH